MSDFLPSDYKDPIIPGNYMSFVDGDNTFRVLSPAITGWEIWGEGVKEGKKVRVPHRFHKDAQIPPEYQDLQTETNRFKIFWAFVVYNRDHKKIQILEITQAGVRKAILALVNNKKWGDPKFYDIVVTRTKTGPLPMDVEYIVTPEPKEDIEPEIVKKFEDMNINLDALYTGKDPFTDNEVSVDDMPDFGEEEEEEIELEKVDTLNVSVEKNGN